MWQNWSKNSLLRSHSEPLFLLQGVGSNTSVALRQSSHTACTQRRRQLAFNPNAYLLPLDYAAPAWNVEKKKKKTGWHGEPAELGELGCLMFATMTHNTSLVFNLLRTAHKRSTYGGAL